MPEVLNFKDRLINELWLPNVKRGGDIFYPKKKNKKMKLLTLTNKNFQEIIKLEKNNITTKESITAWTYGYIKKLRLETELPVAIFGPTRYEDSISSSSFSLSNHFPFDIINLDFSSQDPDFEIGRVEKEIQSLEKTIRIQKQRGKNRFILIYTTLLNSNYLSYKTIVNESNNIFVSEWLGLSSEDFSSRISDQKEKMKCIETVLTEICLKYKYQAKIEMKYFSLEENRKYLYSIVGLLNGKR